MTGGALFGRIPHRYVASILRKFGFPFRAAAAAWEVRAGPGARPEKSFDHRGRPGPGGDERPADERG